MKYTNEQWALLTEEQKREAVIKFQEPDNLYKQDYSYKKNKELIKTDKE